MRPIFFLISYLVGLGAVSLLWFIVLTILRLVLGVGSESIPWVSVIIAIFVLRERGGHVIDILLSHKISVNLSVETGSGQKEKLISGALSGGSFKVDFFRDATGALRAVLDDGANKFEGFAKDLHVSLTPTIYKKCVPGATFDQANGFGGITRYWTSGYIKDVETGIFDGAVSLGGKTVKGKFRLGFMSLLADIDSFGRPKYLHYLYL